MTVFDTENEAIIFNIKYRICDLEYRMKICGMEYKTSASDTEYWITEGYRDFSYFLQVNTEKIFCN
jgi:hypothetical protein